MKEPWRGRRAMITVRSAGCRVPLSRRVLDVLDATSPVEVHA